MRFNLVNFTVHKMNINSSMKGLNRAAWCRLRTMDLS